MCIACELDFFDMLEALPPEERERILREEAARFRCDTTAETPQSDPPEDGHAS